METRASHVLVGLFVVVLSVGLAIVAIWFAQARFDRQVDVYEVVFRSAVSGLQDGAQVTYQGIQVGRVTRIRFDPDDVERVLVRIEVEPSTPVTEDTVARLQPQGITGIFYLELSGTGNEGERLASRPSEPAQIPGRPSTLDRLTTDAPELLNRGVVLLEQATRLLDDDNLERIAAALADIESLTDTAAERRHSVAAIIDDTAVLVAELNEAVTTARATLERLDGAVTTVAADLDGVMVAGRESFEGLAAAAADIERASVELDGLLRDVRVPMRDFSQGGLYEFSALIGETRQLVAAATRITREFERDPAGFLLGGSFKGFQAD